MLHTDNFHCDLCGCCCRAVNQSELYRHLDRGDGGCLYYCDATHTCGIYDTRPEICRVDEMYLQYFADTMSKAEFYCLNYEACKQLKAYFMMG
jgi:Fe-S-cluster containining protein